MIKSLCATTTLYNGVEMPWLGLGVFKAANGEEAVNSVKTAIDAGYRSIDTASAYKNEESVGQGIKDSHVVRNELFITSKVWNPDQGYETTLQAFEDSLNRLDLSYLDLYLIHWPVSGKYKETWKALEKLYKEGRIRAIGVSNFQVHHLEDLMQDANIKPMVNQVEFHPYLTQKELRAYCKQQGIQLEAWSPLGQGKILDHEVLVKIGGKYNKTPAQIILRWDIQNEIVTIPKSVKKNRIIENASIFDFELTQEDMDSLEGLNQNRRFGSDPDNFNF